MVSLATMNPMLDKNHISPQRWWAALLRDPHWWVPVIALILGLLVLEWIQ